MGRSAGKPDRLRLSRIMTSGDLYQSAIESTLRPGRPVTPTQSLPQAKAGLASTLSSRRAKDVSGGRPSTRGMASPIMTMKGRSVSVKPFADRYYRPDRSRIIHSDPATIRAAGCGGAASMEPAMRSPWISAEPARRARKRAAPRERGPFGCRRLSRSWRWRYWPAGRRAWPACRQGSSLERSR